MPVRGLLFALLSLVIPGYLIMGLSSNYELSSLFSQYIGIVTIIIMAILMLFATRLPGLEPLFGPLDKLYLLHKWLGITAIVALLLHNNISPEIDGLPESGLADFGESLGGTSFDFLQILVLITLILIIPYKLWRFTHQFIGVFYILGVLHYLLIPKPFDNFSALGWYVISFGLIGSLSYIYTVWPISSWKMPYRYRASSAIKNGGALTVDLEPIGVGLVHKAGQFAFIRLDNSTDKEIHPFTISSAPNDQRHLRFSIKDLGDYTRNLPNNIKAGDELFISRAFGGFTFINNKRHQVWIAAGIGITPFMAWLQQLQNVDTIKSKIDFFYCVKSDELAPHLEEIKQLSSKLKSVNLHMVISSEGQRLLAENIIGAANNSWPKVSVSFCGPKSMRKTLLEDLTKKGMAKSHFHFEEFEIRTGIGLDRLLLWLYGKSKQHFPDITRLIIEKLQSLLKLIKVKLPKNNLF